LVHQLRSYRPEKKKTTQPEKKNTKMKVFIVFAHPERASLSGSLLDTTISQLQSDGHQVGVSDLYAMNWKSQIDADDFGLPLQENNNNLSTTTAPLRAAKSSGVAFAAGTLTADVKVEQEKLLRADLVILSFPLWWFSMPAIMKGWVDRVFACGFAYGVGEFDAQHFGDRYGEGVMAGKKAMLLVTAGGWEDHYTARGINGPMEDILFPINHGVLFYPGFTVLKPFVEYRVDRTGKEEFREMEGRLRKRLGGIEHEEPIPYRWQNNGDYHIPSMLLKEGSEAEGQKGFDLHTHQNKINS
jgi:NAD(P)H dehydrogenase (quinone)